jgi:glycosyltransferase involved in cell wall biosynthesis
MTTPRPLISIVVPVYNEEANIEHFWQATNLALTPLTARYDFEFVFTDNHSTDQTFARLATLAATHPNVRVIRFSRNFGYQKSIFTGFSACGGAAAIQLDVDLQDPPALIPRFIEHWENDCQVVYGVRQRRQEAWWMETTRRLFYRLINSLSSDPLPLDAGDFRLLDRRVIQELGKHRDAHPYLRGTTAIMGFNQMAVPYERDARRFGETKFSFSKLLELAVDGILNHSIVPLRFASFIGFVAGAVTILLIIGYIIASLVFGQSWPRGFTTTTVLLLTGICLNALLLGIIGEYLGRIYIQVKGHPLVIVEKTINFPEHRPGA